MLDDESDDDGSTSRSAGTCTFPFCFEESVDHVDDSVGCVRGVESRVFLPKGNESIGDVVPLVAFVPKQFESKVSRLIGIFWRPRS